jgi:LmbE family N-acetylglucosaminyl deacetylase
MNKMKTILVIAAHPDDEILGCGGSMAQHIQNGHHVHVVIMAEGLTSRFPTRAEAFEKSPQMTDELMKLRDICIRANQVLGVQDIQFEGFPDNRMDSVDRLDIVKRIESHIKNIKPNIIYTHHIGDVNIDHQSIHAAVVTAARPIPGEIKPDLLFFETASSTEWQTPGSAPPFLPNWFEDISKTLDLKLEALAVYEQEMRPWPHARSIKALEHLARWRGASAGVEAAEAFILGRKIT